MDKKLNFEKENRTLNLSATHPVVVEVPPILFLMVDGTGAPEGVCYKNAAETLYSLLGSISMNSSSAQERGQGIFTPPLESMWGKADDRSAEWNWTLMLRLPDFVTPAVFAWSRERAKRKESRLDFAMVYRELFTEGLCVQVMHHGPLTQEATTVGRLQDFMREQGLVNEIGSVRRCHEISLPDRNQSKSEKTDFILRLPVALYPLTGTE